MEQTPISDLPGLLQQQHAFLFFAVHHQPQRMVKAHMTHILRLLNSRHGIEQILTEKTALTRMIQIYCEIAHLKRSEVLKEMRAL